MTARGVRAAGVALILLLMVGGGIRASHARRPSPAEPVPDSLTCFLDSLSQGSEDYFGKEILSVPELEADSLVRSYLETGRSPAENPLSSPRKWELDAGPGGLRYNRVEGLNLMPQVTISAPTSREMEVFGSLGYGWSAERSTWRMGVRAELSPHWGEPRLEAVLAEDVYRYGSGECWGNSLAALSWGKDYGDYYRGRGLTAALRSGPRPFAVRLEYRRQAHESLANLNPLNLLGGEHAFRANPPVTAGRLALTEFTLEWHDLQFESLAARFRGELARRGLGGDFDFESVHAYLVTRRILRQGDELKLVVSGGLMSGEVPFQSLDHLGGFRTLRGYRVNEFHARRHIHFRADYRVGADLLRFISLPRWLTPQLVPFFDSAALFQTQTGDGSVVDPANPAWRSAAGLGIELNPLGLMAGIGHLRFDIARRLDRGEDNTTLRALVTTER